MKISRGLAKIWQSFRRSWYNLISTNKPSIIPNNAQPVLYSGGGTITIDPSVQLGWKHSPFYYSGYTYIEARKPNSKIEIKEGTIINNNFVCIANDGQISIGLRCNIGVNVEILNSNFHSINPNKRRSGEESSKNVIIGNNVFICNNVKIIAGVHVGNNAVIANGAVVFEDVEANTIVRGNPAVFYKQIYEKEA